MPVVLPLQTLTVEKMAHILLIKPNTMHNRAWQRRTGCPLKKVGKRLIAIESEFNDWLADSRKLNI